MREILFRGKIRGSGAWVEGNLANVKWWFDASPITVIIPTDAYLDPRDGRGPIRYVDVIPETIGQYTGLKDKNGKKIFEGDVVRNSGISVSSLKGPQVVEIFHGRCVPFNVYPDYNCWFPDESEIIGNIHDNPELVEGAK